MPNMGGSFVNWDQFFGANQPQAQGMADGLYDQLSGQSSAAQAGIGGIKAPTDITDPLRRQVSNATQGLNAAANGTYGIQALLQQRNAGTGYTPGQSLYDAALTGAAGGSRFQGLRGQYSNLFGGLERAAAATAPAATPETPATPDPVDPMSGPKGRGKNPWGVATDVDTDWWNRALNHRRRGARGGGRGVQDPTQSEQEYVAHASGRVP
jgi:hypothetical protein